MVVPMEQWAGQQFQDKSADLWVVMLSDHNEKYSDRTERSYKAFAVTFELRFPFPLSPEMVFLPLVAFPLQAITTITTTTCSNLLWWYLSCRWNDVWSAISRDFKNLWRSTGTEKSFLLIGRLKIDIQGRTSVSCNGVNGQYVHLYSFNTVWEPMIWFQQGILQNRSMRKLGQLS